MKDLALVASTIVVAIALSSLFFVVLGLAISVALHLRPHASLRADDPRK